MLNLNVPDARATCLKPGLLADVGLRQGGVDREFFAGTRIQSNFLCSLCYTSPELVHPRGPCG